jgi:hypothetical protein
MADRLTVTFPEQVKIGTDPARQIRALERATRDALKQIQDWVNTRAPSIPRSPFILDKYAGNAQFEQKNCLVHIIEATEPFEFVLPKHERDLLVIVVDGRNGASVNTITLKRSAGRGTIHGVSGDYVINTDNGFAWLMSDGPDQENWWVIAHG